MLGRRPPRGRIRANVGADKAFDVADFAAKLRALGRRAPCRPEQNGPAPSMDRGTTGHPGYAVSQRIREQIEECFARMTTCRCMRKTRHRALTHVAWSFTLTAAACNLIRPPKLPARRGQAGNPSKIR